LRIICHKLTDEQAIGRRRKANLLAKSHKYKSSSRRPNTKDRARGGKVRGELRMRSVSADYNADAAGHSPEQEMLRI
ncbi:MAG: hypothetical protein O7D30_00630, partial [Rickettsia endosymbiont of Ixodes persulcatus]|nr:hypothetical protein [Rickettsia endosymbiont of Ixodes persulcatus]